jgi:hypothetical protein
MMDRPRLIRGLKITVSAVFGVLCVLLILLWVRSYSVSDRIHVPRFGSQTLTSVRGTFSVSLGSETFQGWGWEWKSTPVELMMPVGGPGRSWSYHSDQLHAYLVFPHRFVVLVFAVLAALPWLHWRFSLRTLLIATTLIAVVLGAVMWSMR